MPDVDIDRYSETMRVLARAITNVGTDGRRVQRTGSTASHEVRVNSGLNAVTMIVLEGGLYVKGFRNAHGTFFFKTDPPTLGGTALRFGCSYVGSNSIGIYVDSGDAVCKQKRQKQDITNAIILLSQFQGGNDLALKVPLAIMVLLISESIRFTIVYDRMVEVCKGTHKQFSFLEFQKWVQAWEDISTGMLPEGTSQSHLFTYQK